MLSLETLNAVRSVALESYIIQATSKGSDQTARMRRLVRALAGCTYHNGGNLMLRLIISCVRKIVDHLFFHRLGIL